MELQGQVAIVTGAGRGIGHATALELARMGADVVVAELDRANAERTASELRDLGCRALAVPTDVTSRKDLEAMAGQARAEFGRIDVLVNNAGIYRAAETLNVTEEHWDAVMNINAKAVFFASQTVLPTMIAQKTRRYRQFGIDGRQNREPSQPAIQRQQGGGHQHDQEPRDRACCRWDPRELRVPRLCGDGYVDVGGARTGSAAQPIARRGSITGALTRISPEILPVVGDNNSRRILARVCQHLDGCRGLRPRARGGAGITGRARTPPDAARPRAARAVAERPRRHRAAADVAGERLSRH